MKEETVGKKYINAIEKPMVRSIRTTGVPKALICLGVLNIFLSFCSWNNPFFVFKGLVFIRNDYTIGTP